MRELAGLRGPPHRSEKEDEVVPEPLPTPNQLHQRVHHQPGPLFVAARVECLGDSTQCLVVAARELGPGQSLIEPVGDSHDLQDFGRQPERKLVDVLLEEAQAGEIEQPSCGSVGGGHAEGRVEIGAQEAEGHGVEERGGKAG